MDYGADTTRSGAQCGCSYGVIQPITKQKNTHTADLEHGWQHKRKWKLFFIIRYRLWNIYKSTNTVFNLHGPKFYPRRLPRRGSLLWHTVISCTFWARSPNIPGSSRVALCIREARLSSWRQEPCMREKSLAVKKLLGLSIIQQTNSYQCSPLGSITTQLLERLGGYAH